MSFSGTTTLNASSGGTVSGVAAQSEADTVNKIYVGNSLVKGIYIGNTPVKAVYVGNTKVYR